MTPPSPPAPPRHGTVAAVDLGATSGRVILGHVTDGELRLEDVGVDTPSGDEAHLRRAHRAAHELARHAQGGGVGDVAQWSSSRFSTGLTPQVVRVRYPLGHLGRRYFLHTAPISIAV